MSTPSNSATNLNLILLTMFNLENSNSRIVNTGLTSKKKEQHRNDYIIHKKTPG